MGKPLAATATERRTESEKAPAEPLMVTTLLPADDAATVKVASERVLVLGCTTTEGGGDTHAIGWRHDADKIALRQLLVPL